MLDTLLGGTVDMDCELLVTWGAEATPRVKPASSQTEASHFLKSAPQPIPNHVHRAR
jgi:hypothetical protein